MQAHRSGDTLTQVVKHFYSIYYLTGHAFKGVQLGWCEQYENDVKKYQ